MSAMASQVTGATNVYLAICSGANQRKHQSSASLAFVRGIHRWPVNSSHKGPVTRKMFPFDDVIMMHYLSFVSWAHRSPQHWRFIFYQVKQAVEQIFGFLIIWDATTLMRHYFDMRGIYRWPVNSPHKWPVTQKMFPFEDVIMGTHSASQTTGSHLKIRLSNFTGVGCCFLLESKSIQLNIFIAWQFYLR